MDRCAIRVQCDSPRDLLFLRYLALIGIQRLRWVWFLAVRPRSRFPRCCEPAVRGHEAGKHWGDEAGGLKVLAGLVAAPVEAVAGPATRLLGDSVLVVPVAGLTHLTQCSGAEKPGALTARILGPTV